MRGKLKTLALDFLVCRVYTPHHKVRMRHTEMTRLTSALPAAAQSLSAPFCFDGL